MTQYPIWAEVDLSAIDHNVQEVRKVTSPMTKLMVVVKANGYGHGSVEVAKRVLASGADWLAVARIEEGLILRHAGIDCPILLLGYTPPNCYGQIIKNNFTQTVYNIEMARELNESAGTMGKKASVHIKVDTGMGRLGFLPGDEAVEQIGEVVALPHLTPEAIYTHFANADNSDKSYTNMQFQKFIDFVDCLKNKGISFKIHHTANSAAIIDHPETHLDMVRAGIMIYGLYPSQQVNKQKVNLKPAMTLKTIASHVKKVSAGTHISYGCRYCTQKESLIASLPLGYADGFTRMLSNGEVLVRGQRAPVVGTICMDQCMIDVSQIPLVQYGDEVVVLGRQGSECISADELADKLGTINYEVVCMVSARVPRIYI